MRHVAKPSPAPLFVPQDRHTPKCHACTAHLPTSLYPLSIPSPSLTSHHLTFAELSTEIVTKYGITSSILILIYWGAFVELSGLFSLFLLEFFTFRINWFKVLCSGFGFDLFLFLLFHYNLYLVGYTIFTYTNRALSLKVSQNAFSSNWKLMQQVNIHNLNECQPHNKLCTEGLTNTYT